jgi:ATP-dependent Lon protease
MKPMRDFRDAKSMAQTLRESLTTKAVTISHSESLELVSKMLGVADWNTLSAMLQGDRRSGPSAVAVRPAGHERLQAASYPAVPVRDFVPLPGSVIPLFVGREKSKAALDQAFKSRLEVVLAIQKDVSIDEPGPQDVLGIGLLAHLIEQEQLSDGTLKVVVEAHRRVALHRFVIEADRYRADIEDAGERPAAEATALVQGVLERFERYAAANDVHMRGWPSSEQARDPGHVADVIAMNMLMPLDHRKEVLTDLDPVARLQRISALLDAPTTPLAPAFDTTRRRAMTLATRRNHRYATLEHLLLALLDDADASAVLQTAQADLATLKSDLLGFLGSDRENLFVEPGTAAGPTMAFRRVVQRACLEVQQRGRAAVTGTDVLLGLFPETSSPAARMLEKQGITAALVAEAVARSGGSRGQ